MATSAGVFYFGFKKQAAKGTAVVPDTFVRWLDGSTLEPELKVEEIAEGDGGRDMSLVYKSGQWWKGKLVFHPRPVEVGHILQGIMGVGSDTLTGVGPYTHTMTGKDANPYFTIEMGTTDSVLIAAGGAPINRVQDCVFTSVDIEGEANKPLKVTAEFIGRIAVRQAAALTVTLEAGLPLLFVNGAYLINAVNESVNMSKFKLTMNNNVDSDTFTNSITPLDLLWTQRKLSFETELIFQNDSYFRQMFYGTAAGTTDSAVLFNGAVDLTCYQGGDTADPDKLQVQVPKVNYTGKPFAPKLDRKTLRQELSGTVSKPDSGSIATAILTNTRATAY